MLGDMGPKRGWTRADMDTLVPVQDHERRICLKDEVVYGTREYAEWLAEVVVRTPAMMLTCRHQFSSSPYKILSLIALLLTSAK